MLGEHCPLLGQLILPKDSELACKDDGARNTNPGINLEDEPQLHRFNPHKSSCLHKDVQISDAASEAGTLLDSTPD